MKLDPKRINHITIAVPAGEHDRVREFYGGLLGLEEIETPPAVKAKYDVIWYRLLDILLHMDFTPPWSMSAENRHVAIEIRELAEFRRYLEDKGATIREAVPMEGIDRFYLLDPFGTYFELLKRKSSRRRVPDGIRR
jgi:catechol 2,3-dioxygenase-like lactoylglutathione lyase family enzyme